MSTVVSPPLPPALPATAGKPEDFIWRMSVAQYHDMIDKGILTEDDPVELLEGWLVCKMTKNPPHSVATGLIEDQVRPLLPADWCLRVQEPITLADSEPEPDVAAVRGDRRRYRSQHPGPRDVGLLMEVADATLDRDRGSKKRIYARAGIPVYWIVNLLERQIEVYTQPRTAAAVSDYDQREDFRAGTVVPVILDGQEIGRIAVNDILP